MHWVSHTTSALPPSNWQPYHCQLVLSVIHQEVIAQWVPGYLAPPGQFRTSGRTVATVAWNLGGFSWRADLFGTLFVLPARFVWYCMTRGGDRYHELIRVSPAPINLFDATGEIIWGNDAVLDLLGLASRDDLIGRSIFEFIHAEDRYTAEQELAAVVEKKIATGPTPMKLERDDGEQRSIRVATAPGRYEGQDIGQAVVIDDTELHQLRERLEEEQEFIENALDVLEDIFYVLAPDGTLERWNESLTRVSGYTPSEVESMTVEEFFIDDHAERISESISRGFVEGTDTTEATVRTKSGERIPYEFRKQRLHNDGDVIGLVGIGRNVTQRKTREQHLRAVDYLLQHHLRNQLNVIRGRTELLVDAAGVTDTTHRQSIQQAADTMLSLFDHHREVVDYLLTSTERTDLDIVAIIEDLFTELETEYPEARLSLDAPDSAIVLAAPRLDYAFRELFSNALTHSDAATPRLAVRIDGDASPVTIEVRDNGPQISRTEYAYLEDIDVLEDTAHPSGLGLWSVNLAVKYSHGSMTIDHPTSRGNTITIELPASTRDWSFE